MIQVAPQKDLPIIRQLSDHTDTGTNYVQAKIYKASDNSLLATVNLIDNGNQYFYNTWQTIQDTSGEGTWIIIITTVYTDSGYTIKNPNYALETREYLIKADSSFLGGGGGGVDIDYKKIKKMIDEALMTLPKPEKQKEIDYDRINESIKSLETGIRKDLSQLTEAILQIPPIPAPDYSEILSSIEEIKKQIDARPVYKEPNFDRISNKIEMVAEELKASLLNSIDVFSNFKKVLQAIEDIGKKIDEVQLFAMPIFAMPKDFNKKPEEKENKTENTLFDNL